MPRLIKLHWEGPAACRLDWVEDPFVHLADDESLGSNRRAVIISIARFQSDGAAWLADGLTMGLRLKPDEPVEQVVDALPNLALVALEFPKFRDGRGYSAAELLRNRYDYTGQLRAVGEVLRDQAVHLIRCGFDAFEPSDGSTPDVWAHSAFRFRNVYQAAAAARLSSRTNLAPVEDNTNRE
jgi:uncharacterized protein (DUF934 family)